jgi:heat shock protein 1/8
MRETAIEFAFDINTYDTLNVSASDKTTGKSNRMAITSDKNHLSQEVVVVVGEAEKYEMVSCPCPGQTNV